MGSVADQWNATYFGNRLSPGALAALDPLNQAKADAQALVDRTFRLMRVARLDPTDLPVRTAALLASVTSAVPSAWDGAVPPITMAGRHQKLDHYIATNPWHRPADDPVLVDLGCGFPPFTAIDSAARLTGWRIIGADPSFPRYLVHDGQGDYACFDDHQNLRYHRHGHLDPNSAVTRTRFRDLLYHLLPLLPDHDAGELAEVAHDGARLVRNPLRRYETENHETDNHETDNHETQNLALVQAGVGSFAVEGGADVIRCMNVLMYFDQPFRRTCLEWARGVLRPGGLVICGSNWARSTHSRYTVYQQQDRDLAAREFAFSIDNLRPIGIAPWYALHDDNVENLCNAEAVGIIRRHEAFRRRFDARLDALFAQTGLCRRDADGYLRGPEDSVPDDSAPPADLEECTATVAERLDREGFVDEAVAVLRSAGREAWRNSAGHIAMHPVPPHPLPASAVGL
ncbi:MAG: hypothetical protein ACRDS0_21755 [Pseudonocardiaceae bacterium]